MKIFSTKILHFSSKHRLWVHIRTALGITPSLRFGSKIREKCKLIIYTPVSQHKRGVKRNMYFMDSFPDDPPF